VENILGIVQSLSLGRRVKYRYSPINQNSRIFIKNLPSWPEKYSKEFSEITSMEK